MARYRLAPCASLASVRGSLALARCLTVPHQPDGAAFEAKHTSTRNPHGGAERPCASMLHIFPFQFTSTPAGLRWSSLRLGVRAVAQRQPQRTGVTRLHISHREKAAHKQCVPSVSTALLVKLEISSLSVSVPGSRVLRVVLSTAHLRQACAARRPHGCLRWLLASAALFDSQLVECFAFESRLGQGFGGSPGFVCRVSPPRLARGKRRTLPPDGRPSQG